MKTYTQDYDNAIRGQTRQITAVVKVYNSSNTLLYTLTAAKIKNLILRTTGDGVMFGQALSTEFIGNFFDKNLELNLRPGYRLDVRIGVWTVEAQNEYQQFQPFWITNVERDEKGGTINVEAYDRMYFADDPISKLNLSGTNLTPSSIVDSISVYLGTGVVRSYQMSNNWTKTYVYNVSGRDSTLNLYGDESLRQVLQWVCEITGSVCFINSTNNLEFTKAMVHRYTYNVPKSQYFTLNCSDEVTMTGLAYQDEMQNVITAQSGAAPYDGEYYQILMCNPFMTLLSNQIRSQMLNNVLGVCRTGGEYPLMRQYTLDWRGNPALEIGDELYITTKDGSQVYIPYLCRNLTYDGGLRERISFSITSPSAVGAQPNNVSDSVRASIDYTKNSIALKADKIDLQGKVSFTDLSTAGATTINGSNITTGTIDASQVTVNNINASNITTGSLSANLITTGNMSANRISGGSIDANNVTITNVNAKTVTTSATSSLATTGCTISADGSIETYETMSGLDSRCGLAAGIFTMDKTVDGEVSTTVPIMRVYLNGNLYWLKANKTTGAVTFSTTL